MKLLRYGTVIMGLLLLVTVIVQHVLIQRQQEIIRDQQIYMENGCRGHYQGEGS
jgi:hypothetical protein